MDTDEQMMRRAMAEQVAIGRDGYSRFGRGVIIAEAAHHRAVRYLSRSDFEAELLDRFGMTLGHDDHTRQLAALLDSYDPETEAIYIAYTDDGGFQSFLSRTSKDTAQSTPVHRADVPTDFVGLVDRIPALAESGALETIGAIAWKGYQKQGRGVVVYLPTYGDLDFRPAREYTEMIRDAIRQGHFPNADPTSATTEDYDPFAEVLFGTMLRLPNGKGEWVLIKTKTPKPPQRCKATWKPAPRTDAA